MIAFSDKDKSDLPRRMRANNHNLETCPHSSSLIRLFLSRNLNNDRTHVFQPGFPLITQNLFFVILQTLFSVRNVVQHLIKSQ